MAVSGNEFGAARETGLITGARFNVGAVESMATGCASGMTGKV